MANWDGMITLTPDQRMFGLALMETVMILIVLIVVVALAIIAVNQLFQRLSGNKLGQYIDLVEILSGDYLICFRQRFDDQVVWDYTVYLNHRRVTNGQGQVRLETGNIPVDVWLRNQAQLIKKKLEPKPNLVVL